MTASSSAKRFPGPNPIDGLDISENPEFLRTVYPDVYHQLFLLDTTTAIQAFRAITSVAAYWWKKSKQEPSESVEIPSWAVQAIAIGFCKYQDAISEGQEPRFGEALGLELNGQGRKPRLVEVDRRLRDLKLALSVAIQVDNGVPVGAAIEKLAKNFLVSKSTAWRLWSQHKEFVRDCLAKHNTLTTSGSVESEYTS